MDYTTTRANADFDVRLTTKTTSQLAEGSNLYYTTARWDARLATKTLDDIAQGSVNKYIINNVYDDSLTVEGDFDASNIVIYENAHIE
eukprot:3086118-Rhodomonas_salina.1